MVVDRKINSNEVEMYAERTAKGGVLEPEGLIEIKFRTNDLLQCMHRLDKQLISLKMESQKANDRNIGVIIDIQQKIKAHEK